MRSFDKVLIISSIFIALCGILQADMCEEYGFISDCEPSSCLSWNAELRTAYFCPSSKLERDIYEGARFDAELELSTPIYQDIDVWTNLAYYYKHGQSVELHEGTNLQLIPLTLGLKYVCPLSCQLSMYAGVGINYTWLHLHDDLLLSSQSINKSRMGATWASGIYYQMNDRWFADLFIDYLYIPMRLANVYNVGGVRLGIGLGVHL